MARPNCVPGNALPALCANAVACRAATAPVMSSHARRVDRSFLCPLLVSEEIFGPGTGAVGEKQRSLFLRRTHRTPCRCRRERWFANSVGMLCTAHPPARQSRSWAIIAASARMVIGGRAGQSALKNAARRGKIIWISLRGPRGRTDALKIRGAVPETGNRSPPGGRCVTRTPLRKRVRICTPGTACGLEKVASCLVICLPGRVTGNAFPTAPGKGCRHCSSSDTRQSNQNYNR